MISSANCSRRQFLQHAVAVAAAATMVPGLAKANPSLPDALAGRLFKTLKIGMIKGGSLTERLDAA